MYNTQNSFVFCQIKWNVVDKLQTKHILVNATCKMLLTIE